MKKLKLCIGMMLSIISFVLVNPIASQAKERETTMSITKEGKYVVKDYKQLYEEDYDTCEVLFTPEKTGVYSLTTSINDKCSSVIMDIFTEKYSFDQVVTYGKDKERVDVNKKVYLE